MLLSCNLCKKYVKDRHIPKTDNLWLRTINGRDYLVCSFHRGGYHERQAKVSRNSDGVSNPTGSRDE